MLLWHSTWELLREWWSHSWHLSLVWHSWLTLELSRHWHSLLHTTSRHSASSTSLASSSSHAISSSLSTKLLWVWVTTWATSTTWEWLASLIWLSWLDLWTYSHISNSFNDLVKDLMNFSVFFSFLLLFELILR